MAPKARPARGEEAKEQRRDDILTAAKAVFAEQGYHATTIADVARAAGISYGSIYWYFDSKEALFHALMDNQEQALRAHIDRTVAELGEGIGGEALFRDSVRATFEFFEADRAVVKLLFRDSLVLGDRFDRHLAGIYEGFIADIEKTIATAQSAGYVIDAPPRMIAFSVAALIGQLALRRLATDDGLPADVVADFVVTLLLDGLRPRQLDGSRPRRSQ
ncbi:MAG TPA: helix-turn-helix domain-containing protein [Microthrixaceae bacterium]|nr:helix-turn-helix domain-containing protein [Microthrixaceae bacterium]